MPAYGPESDALSTTCISGDDAMDLFTEQGLSCPLNQVLTNPNPNPYPYP